LCSEEYSSLQNLYDNIAPNIKELEKIYRIQCFPNSDTLRIGDFILSQLETELEQKTSSNQPFNLEEEKKNICSRLNPRTFTHVLCVLKLNGKFYAGIIPRQFWFERNATNSVNGRENTKKQQKPFSIQVHGITKQERRRLKKEQKKVAEGDTKKIEKDTNTTNNFEDDEVEETISRAYHKLKESVDRFKVNLPPHFRALDIGAAPGGMTQYLAWLLNDHPSVLSEESSNLKVNPFTILLKDGGSTHPIDMQTVKERGVVVAIDPAILTLNLGKNNNAIKGQGTDNVIHLQMKGEEALEHAKPFGPFDIIVCDVNALPETAMDILEPFLPLLTKGGWLIWTIKRYWSSNRTEDIVAAFTEKFGPLMTDIQIKWLLANKQERMLAATRA
jgi:predicted rRNA methylase YqxC with S4 and FtsJ domains